jgi:exonuclease VII large subunit
MESAFGKSKGEILDPLPTGNLPGMNIIQGVMASQTYDMCKDIAETIKKRHPNAKAIYTEQEVYSKQVDGEYLKVINAITQIKSGHYTHVKGIFDLIVIDKDGVVHIYDYKTVTKEFGNS